MNFLDVVTACIRASS